MSRYQADQAPDDLDVVAVIGNPIVVDDFPFSERRRTTCSGSGGSTRTRAQAARSPPRGRPAPGSSSPVPVQPGQEEFFAREVEPHIDGRQIRYIGEVGEEKAELYAGARALLMPIRWPEPFGLVMTEAMACGTPVIAFPEGSAPEIVLDGETGFIVDDEDEMAAAVGRLGEIDPARCRESARERFDVTPRWAPRTASPSLLEAVSPIR